MSSRPILPFWFAAAYVATNDEFVKATVIRAEGQPDAAMEDGDRSIFMNYRADRARGITRAFVNADLDGSRVESG
ncbi:hypothetical protein ACNKHV_22730 [Shigella flexneri]